MHNLSIDLETFSSIDIKTAGLYRYVESPDFEILLFGYSWDGAPTVVVDFTDSERLPEWLVRALSDAEVIKRAFNAPFEWCCLSRYLRTPLPISQWRCTMLHSLYCGYPASLSDTCDAVGMTSDKKKLTTGRALIRLFSVPCAPTKKNGGRTRTLPAHEPEKWRLYKTYNAQDVEAEMELERLLSPWPVPDFVQRQWEIDVLSNARGVAVDTSLISGALRCSDEAVKSLTLEAATLTEIDNPNSVAQLKKWLCKELKEDEIASLDKEAVKGLIEASLPGSVVGRVLEIRQALGKTSTKKYMAMANSLCSDGRIRGLLMFYGANRTGRWAGRLVQVQNLPRTHLQAIDLARELVKEGNVEALNLLYGTVPNTLSQLVRTAFVPAAGHVFVDADFSAIEARVIAWLAGEEWVLEVFRTHGKIYEATAAQMFGVALDRIVKGNDEYELRQRGKVATLALGYQGGINALTTMDISRAIADEEKPSLVKKWRTANPNIVALWHAVEDAALDTVKTGRTNYVRGLTFALESALEQWFLSICLPSGRKLFYCRPRIVAGNFGGDAVQYMGLQQTTHKWAAVYTYGGKLVENIVQAIARDCLAVSIERLEVAGYKIVFHVHDEVIIESPKEKADLKAVCTIMGSPISWAPGLPLKAEGWVGDYFTKD